MGKRLSPSSSVEEVEARAALSGLHALETMYKGPMELEMDCKSVIMGLTNTDPCLSPCFAVIQDIKSMAARFASHKFSFVGRECNALAHEITAEARRVGDMHATTRVPDRLRDMMLKECNNHLE